VPGDPSFRSPRPILIPPEVPGMPGPTDDDAPEAVTFMRIYAAALALGHLALFVFGALALAAPQLVTSHATAVDLEAVFVGVFYMVWGLGFAVPWAIVLLGARKPWVHTLATVLVAFSMLSFCCLPAAIPLVIGWGKPEVRRWYTS
jgi:hypothetical protein